MVTLMEVGSIMLYVHKKYVKAIEHYNIWSERIEFARVRTKRNHITLLRVCVQVLRKQALSSEFCETLQKAVQRAGPQGDLIIFGDTNAQVEDKKIGKCVCSFGLVIVNTNGKRLSDF